MIFIDGTKILADANKYSFVWKKNTIRYKAIGNSLVRASPKPVNSSETKSNTFLAFFVLSLEAFHDNEVLTRPDEIVHEPIHLGLVLRLILC